MAYKHIEMIEEYLYKGCEYEYFDNHGTLTRCKDCVYFGDDGSTKPVRCCKRDRSTMAFVSENDYCSKAKRKDDEK